MRLQAPFISQVLCCYLESRHKDCVFVSEVFRFEVLGFERVDEDFYKVYFRDAEIGEFDAEALRFRSVQVMR